MFFKKAHERIMKLGFVPRNGQDDFEEYLRRSYDENIESKNKYRSFLPKSYKTNFTISKGISYDKEIILIEKNIVNSNLPMGQCLDNELWKKRKSYDIDFLDQSVYTAIAV